MTPGKSVTYGDGVKIRVIDVAQGLFRARALIETTYRDHSRIEPRSSDQCASRNASRSWARDLSPVGVARRPVHAPGVLVRASRHHPELRGSAFFGRHP